MKKFRKVELTRRSYHAEPARDSVHRSSLTVPEISGTVAEISFVNHFLLKRNYTRVGCRISGIGRDGTRIGSLLFEISEPRVHRHRLTGMFEDDVSTYLVEFFAAENLFIPFPAVMINHWGSDFINSVHAYNRSLNDVFENEAISQVTVREASIDVMQGNGFETFLVFAAGPMGYRGELEIELAREKEIHHALFALDVSRYTSHTLNLSDILPDAPDEPGGVLKIRAGRQPMFFGRMLAGIRTASGAFSGNHSYYDSSETEEYWDDGAASVRLYPLFKGIRARVRVYPIMSPGTLNIAIALYGPDGQCLETVPVGQVVSPGNVVLDVSLHDVIERSSTDTEDVAGFAMIAQPAGARTPTRINHQLLYEAGGLASSINTSLLNPNVFTPENKPGYSWGQLVLGARFETLLGISCLNPTGADDEIEVTLYDETGPRTSRRWHIPCGGVLTLDPQRDFDVKFEQFDAAEPQYIWYIAKGSRTDLTAYTVTRDIESNHCTGEHAF